MALRWLKAVVAALSLVLAVAPAGAGDFTDAAGRHVVLPAQIGIPYILIDDSFARVSRSLRSVAAIL